MPASRKRMKGRARKASRNAALPPPKSGQALRASPTSQQHQLPQMLPQDSCSHGVPTPPAEPGTKLAAFLNTFLEELGQEDCTFAQSSLAGALQTHEYFPSVWENEGDRKHLRDIIVRSGVKTITRDNNRYPNQAKIDGAAGLAMAIFMLENYDAATKLVDDFFVLKNLDIFHGCERQVVDFFACRISCGCLDAHCHRAKTLPKSRICGYCNVRRPRNSLLYCTGCERRQYCSKACQLAEWPRHKESCCKMQEFEFTDEVKRAFGVHPAKNFLCQPADG